MGVTEKTLLNEQEKQFWENLLIQYAQVAEKPFSLHELFPAMVEFADGFEPHVKAAESNARVKAILQSDEFGLWLGEFSEGFNTMSAELHRSAREIVMDLMGLYYDLLFYVDDTVTANANNPELLANRQRYKQVKEYAVQLAAYLQNSSTNIDSRNPLYRLTIKILHGFQNIVLQDIAAGKTEAASWLGRFVSASANHLSQALKHDNTVNLGRALAVNEYERSRFHDSGMATTLALGEISSGEYINWEKLEIMYPDMYKKIILMRKSCGVIAAYVNDFFSFHKEVIEPPHSDYNLITVFMRSKNISLPQAVIESAAYTNQLISEYIEVEKQLRDELTMIKDASLLLALQTHLQNLKEFLQATWAWELNGTFRYKSRVSIFWELISEVR